MEEPSLSAPSHDRHDRRCRRAQRHVPGLRPVDPLSSSFGRRFICAASGSLFAQALLLACRLKYNRRFVNKTDGFGKKGPNSNAGQA